jgi:O-6-methylguanine DNA methyltransferase
MDVAEYASPIGTLRAGASAAGICFLRFADEATGLAEVGDARNPHLIRLGEQLEAYFAGRRREFDVPLVIDGTDFQRAAWSRLREIPYGTMRSYKEQATAVGNSKAVRAVARANNQNRLSIIIPCHRVIGSDGTLVGYGGGLDRKRFLLRLEGALA